MLVPTRGRPDAAWEAAGEAMRLSRAATQVYLLVDGDDDPRYNDGTTLAAGVYRCFSPRHRGMVATLNYWATRILEPCPPTFVPEPYTHVGFMGDDHRPRTVGWDLLLMQDAGDGIAYGNDLFQGARLPTSVVMHADIVRALEYMALPALGHLYVDDHWLALGRAMGKITYRDDVVIEHMHPSAGKAPTDDQYRRVNSPERFEADRDAYREHLLAGGFEREVETIRRYREKVAAQ